MDNAANTHVCRDKSLFVGELRDSDVSLDTATGVNGPRMKLGSIKVAWSDDAGVTHDYTLHDVIYNPKSPFNILSVGRLGAQFGKTNADCDDDGTYIKSSANFSTFTWDHGKFTRTFPHSGEGLPEMPVNVGNSCYHSFCSRIKRVYDDSVSHAFATAVVDYEPDELDLPAHDNDDDQDFRPGDDIYYKQGDGNNHQGRYIKSISNNGAMLHEIRLETGDTITTSAAHLSHLDQPDVTNIPIDIPTYCKEVEKGLTKEDVEAIARPQTLSPLQQEFLHRHYRSYHLPFH